VYEILKKDKLVLSQLVFEDIQQRLLYQYTYSPKRRTMMQQQMILEECAELVELRNIEAKKEATA
jgi:hypothetical protein